MASTNRLNGVFQQGEHRTGAEQRSRVTVSTETAGITDKAGGSHQSAQQPKRMHPWDAPDLVRQHVQEHKQQPNIPDEPPYFVTTWLKSHDSALDCVSLPAFSRLSSQVVTALASSGRVLRSYVSKEIFLNGHHEAALQKCHICFPAAAPAEHTRGHHMTGNLVLVWTRMDKRMQVISG